MTTPTLTKAIAGMVCTFCGERMKGGEDVFTTVRDVPHPIPSWLNPDGVIRVQGVAHAVCPRDEHDGDEPFDDPARWSFIDEPPPSDDPFAEAALDHRAPID